jgi:ABC-type uncharacterized transport system permease subunit
MKNKKLITSIAITIVAAGVAVYVFKRIRKHRMLNTVADAGYETAHDIHFPLKHNRPRRYRRIE